MRRVERFYPVGPKHRGSVYREGLYDVVEEDWLLAPDAEKLLIAERVQTPWALREYLAWRANRGLLQSKAAEIVDNYGGGEPYQVVYEQVPLLEEWEDEPWSSSFADFWITGNLTITRNKDSCRVLTNYNGISFDRTGIMAVVELFRQPIATLPTGDPGRPTKGRQLYLAEFDRRAVEGLVLDQLRAEAVALKDWFCAEHPSADPPSVGSIENNIRSKWRSLTPSP